MEVNTLYLMSTSHDTTDPAQNYTSDVISPSTAGEEVCRFGVDSESLRKASWYTVGFMVLILATVLGNLLIILAILLEPHLRTTANLFYVSLASADFLVGAFVMPMMLLNILHGCWPLGATVCDLWLSVDNTTTSASFFGLCVIAADRYSAISDPFKHMRKQSKNRVRLHILAVWGCAALAWVPAIITSRALSGETEDYECDDVMWAAYVVICCSLVYYLPTVIMLVLYVMLYVKIRQQLRGAVEVKDNKGAAYIADTSETPSCNETTLTTSSSKDSIRDPDVKIGKSGSNAEINRKRNERHMRAQKEARAARTLGVIMVAFLLCWTWWIVVWPMLIFAPDMVPNWLYEMSVWLAYLNSCMNPFLYVFSSEDFRKAVFRILTCGCIKKR